MPTNQSPSNQASLLRLTKIICTFLNEVAKVEQGAYFISREEIGGSCHSIKVLIGTYQRSSQNTLENIIVTSCNSIMEAVERVTQEIQIGKYHPPQIPPMPQNRSHGPPPPMPGACPPNRQLPP